MSESAIWSASSGPDDAPPLVLVHGSLDRSAGLLRLSRRLSDRFRVVRYDRRGYGRSVPHAGPFGMPGQVDDLESVVARQAVAAPMVLFGHSFGGNVALAFADRHPDQVAAVFTYESPMSWMPWWPSDSVGSRALDGEVDPGEAAERFMRGLIGDEKWERLPPATRAARRNEGPAIVGELDDLRRNAPWRGDRVSAPVLALYGEGGREYHRRAAEAIAEQVVNGLARDVADARHFGPNTHPDAVAEIVAEFVAA